MQPEDDSPRQECTDVNVSVINTRGGKLGLGFGKGSVQYRSQEGLAHGDGNGRFPVKKAVKSGTAGHVCREFRDKQAPRRGGTCQ